MPEDLTYGDLPPNVEAYLSRPGVNREKALQWFSLGISEPQTYNQAKLLAEAVGNSPEQAKVVAGQWQFESGGGVHMGANHNYFGIQAHTQAVRDRLIARGINVGVGDLTDTPEVRNGKTVTTKNKFMAFDNAFDGFQAHRVFLETNPIYEGALAAKTAKDFAKGLEKAGYATATNYGTTLYNNYVLPKEKSPLSGDTRPKSFGPTTSKVKLGTSEAGQTPEIVPALPTKPLELIETNTLGVRPEISTSPAQADYIPTNSAPVVIPASEAMQMSAPKGWFGSGKSTFNAMGGSLNNSGFHALPKEVQNKIRTNMNNKRFEMGGPTEGFQGPSKPSAAFPSMYVGATPLAPIDLKNEAKHHGMELRNPNAEPFMDNLRSQVGPWGEFGSPKYQEYRNAYYADKMNPKNKAFRTGEEDRLNMYEYGTTFENGGPMGQLTEFNSGGSHEESPLGGIPQGQAPDGGTNLVEQGETKLNVADYIFSKTLKIDKETAQEFNLKPNFVNKDFAEASKIANRKDSRRENDTIETKAIQRDLDNLMNAQEAFKQKVVEKKLAEIQALDPNALEQIAQSYQPQGMPPQGMEQGMPQGQPSPEEMAMMQQQQGQGQPPMDPAMMQQMMAQQQGAPQMPMQYGGPMSYKCGGGMYEYGGNLSRQFYGGGTMPGSNFSDSGNYYGLNNQGLTTNGLNTQQAAGNNGLSGGQYAQMGLSAVNAGANINRINKSDMSQDAKTSAYGDTASQIGDSTVQTIFPALAPAFAAKNAYQEMLTSNVNPETGEKAYKKGFQASSNEAVTPIHTRQIKGVTDFAKDKSAANFGKMAWNFMDPGSAQLFDSAKGIWGKDKYAENQTAIDLNQASQAEAYNQQQLAAQQQQQNMINSAVQAGLAGYQPQDDINSNFAKYGGHQFSTAYPNFKNSAGPMGQPLTNVYAMGGMFDGLGDPVKTTTASTVPAGTLNPNYAAQLKEYNDSENILKGLNTSDYKALDINAPEHSDKRISPSGLTLNTLYGTTGSVGGANFYKYNTPEEYLKASTTKTVVPQSFGFTSANQGIAMPERGTTENGIPMVANRQYSQYLEEAANSPEAIMQRDAVNAERAASIQRIANAGPAIQETTSQRLARERAEYAAKNQGGNNHAMGGSLGMGYNNEFGGDLDSPTEEDMINHLNNLGNSTTHSFDPGGFIRPTDAQLQAEMEPGYWDNYSYLFPKTEREGLDYQELNNVIDPRFKRNEKEVAQQMLREASTEEELAKAQKYLSDLEAADESLKNKNLNLNMNQTWAQAAGLALPAAYNIQQGLFGKVGTLNPEDYYQKADFTPYQYNDNPQKRAIETTFASLRKDLGNIAAGQGGGYGAALQAAANSRNASLGELNAQKENINAANALDAKVRNKAIEAANKGILSNVTDYNIKAKEAKRKTLAEGLKQAADIARSSTEMDAQSTYLKAIAPDFANTIGYNSIVDQLLASRKASKEAKNKNDKTA